MLQNQSNKKKINKIFFKNQIFLKSFYTTILKKEMLNSFFKIDTNNIASDVEASVETSLWQEDYWKNLGKIIACADGILEVEGINSVQSGELVLILNIR